MDADPQFSKPHGSHTAEISRPGERHHRGGSRTRAGRIMRLSITGPPKTGKRIGNSSSLDWNIQFIRTPSANPRCHEPHPPALAGGGGMNIVDSCFRR